MVIFGMTAEEVAEQQRAGFTGADAVDASPRLAAVVDSLADGDILAATIRIVSCRSCSRCCDYDRFMVAADFDAYWEAQRAVDALWRSPPRLVARFRF